MSLNFNEGMIQILQYVHDNDKPSTTDIKEAEQVLEHYEPNSIPRTCRRLAKHNYLDRHGGRPQRYSLTEDGYQIIKKRREKKQRRVQAVNNSTNTLGFGDAVERFREYFRIDNIEQQLIERSLDDDPAVIDIGHLERVDADLADTLIDRPNDLLDAATEAIDENPAIDGTMPIKVTNLPDHRQRTIRELSSDEIQTLVTVPGIVLKTSKNRPRLVAATFECTACGSQETKDQDGTKLKSPYKCECGCRKFNTVDRTFEDIRILKLQEKPDSPDQKTIKVHIPAAMTNETKITEMKPGTAVEITAIVDVQQTGRGNNTTYKRYLEAVDVSHEQTKWDEVNISPEDHERNKQIADKGAVDVFKNSVAVEKVTKRGLMKEAFLLYLLGKRENESNLNVLVVGEPGTGKSKVGDWAEQHLPKTIKAIATTSTEVGLTATVKEDPDFGGYVAEGGSLTLADGGYHLTDEFDKMNDTDVKAFNEALEKNTITLNKGDIRNLQLSADVSEWATANPRGYDYFDRSRAKYQQLPIPENAEATKDRFDIIIGLEEYAPDSDAKEEVIEHILNRGDQDYDGTTPEYDPDDLVKFITEASTISPTFTAEAKQTLKTAYFNLKEKEPDDQQLISNRKLGGLKKLAIAYARADLSDEVTANHAQNACNFFRRSLNSIDFQIGKDSFTNLQSPEATQREEVLEAIETVADEDGLAAVENVIDEADLEEETVEETIEELDSDGEIFEPRSGRIKIL